MNRRALGNGFMILGLIIMAVSVYKYLDIKGAQREMLEIHEASATEVETPVMLQETRALEETIAAPLQPASESKPVTKREDYKNGLMTIAIPKLQVEAGVVNGTSVPQLKKGPGLYEGSPLPDQDGANVCIAGHRTTYGAWFRNVDQLEKGDEIILDYNGHTYVYQVQKVFVVDKKDWSVIEPQGFSAITLTSCHPLRSSKQRIVVRGTLLQ